MLGDFTLQAPVGLLEVASCLVAARPIYFSLPALVLTALIISSPIACAHTTALSEVGSHHMQMSSRAGVLHKRCMRYALPVAKVLLQRVLTGPKH